MLNHKKIKISGKVEKLEKNHTRSGKFQKFLNISKVLEKFESS